MREQIIFFISVVIIFILALIIMIQGAYNYRKVIKNLRNFKSPKRFSKLKT
jgi:hypothetical protein